MGCSGGARFFLTQRTVGCRFSTVPLCIYSIRVTFPLVLHPMAKMKQQEAVPAGLEDVEVVAEVVRGNREMFEVLVRRYNQRLYRIGIGYLKKPELVEDAMQEAYLKAFLNLDRFRGGSSFATWLTRIMINECLMALRKERRVVDALAGAVRETVAPAEMDNSHAAKKATLNEMKTLLEKSIANLPDLYRIVFILREVQQLSTREAAECLSITPDSVKVRLHRAREALKNALMASASGAELFSYGAERCDRMTARVMAAVMAAV